MKRNVVNRVSAVALATAVLAGGASAATFLKIEGLGFGDNVTFDYNSASTSFWSGEQLVKVDQGAGYIDPAFIAYCIDLEHVNAVNNIYTVVPKATGLHANGGKIAWLYNTYVSSVTSNTLGAALQLAIWDAVYDGGDGLAAGNVQSNGSTNAAVGSQATTWLTALGSNTDSAIWFDAVHDNNKYQNLIGPDGSATPVPEPFTLLLAAAGLGVAAKRRRRKA